MSYDQLKVASLTHSVVYLCLLTVWLLPGLHGAEFVFGLTHGLGWIAMSLICIDAVRRRVIPIRTAVAVSVLGGIAPFFGTWEFFRHRPASL